MPPKKARDRKNFDTDDNGRKLPNDFNSRLWTIELLKNLCAHLGKQYTSKAKKTDLQKTLEGVTIPGRDQPEESGISAPARATPKKQDTKLKKGAEDSDEDDASDPDEPATRKSKDTAAEPEESTADAVASARRTGGKKKRPLNGYVTDTGRRKAEAEASVPASGPRTPVPTKAPTSKQKILADEYLDNVRHIRGVMLGQAQGSIENTPFESVYGLLGWAVDALDDVAQLKSRQASPEVDEAVEEEEEEPEVEEKTRSSSGSSKRDTAVAEEDGDYEDQEAPPKKKSRKSSKK